MDDINFVIMQGYGYAIPKKILSDEEIKQINELIEFEDDDFGFAQHGTYHETDESQIFLFLHNQADIIADIILPDSNSYNCQDFSVPSFYDEDDYHKNDEGENHAELLATIQIGLDSYLKEKVPSLFLKITDNYSKKFDKWLFGHFDSFEIVRNEK